jgi:hypothetical protein
LAALNGPLKNIISARQTATRHRQRDTVSHHDTRNNDSQRPLENRTTTAIPSNIVRARAHGPQRRTNDPNPVILSLSRENAILGCCHVTSKQRQPKGELPSMKHPNRGNKALDNNTGMEKSRNQQEGGFDNVYV